MTMSKVVKQIILWDTDRIGNDVEYHYLTASMTEDDQCLKMRVFADELCEFIEENEMNQHQTDVDSFSSIDAESFLIDQWEEVKERYWDEVIYPKLDQSYAEALAYVESFKAKSHQPMTEAELATMLKRVEANYGIHLGKEAA